MKTNRTIVFALLAAAAPWPSLLAQTTAPAAAPAAPPEEEVLQLSPFEVNADDDNGYLATQTLAGTRIRTDLKDVGSAISVVTKQFMADIGATDSSTLLQYTTNAEVAGTRGTYAGLGNGTTVDETANLRSPGGAQRVRGLASADNTRDFFVTDIPWDSYNVERIDIQRGPNAILFGLGSPAGIVNASINGASFRNGGNVTYRVGSYGSQRGSVDLNQVLIKDVLAIRIDGLWSEEKFQQEPAFQNDKRFAGAVRFDPQFFGPSFHTSFKAKYENGDIQANRPRNVPPNDSITPWFRPTDNTSLNGGMNKYSVNSGYDTGAAVTSANPWLTSAGVDQQQPIWFMDGTTDQLYRIYGGWLSTGSRNSDGSIRAYTDSLLGYRYSPTFFGVNSLPAFATTAKLPNYQYGQYRNTSLQDSSVFDFYNKLLDGPNKSEYEKWDAYNLDLSQTGWDDRVGVQLTYDRQKYTRGGEGLVTNPTLNIDVLRNFQDLVSGVANATNTASANPNYARPYVVGGPGGGSSYDSDREYIRASLFGEVRARDFLTSDFWTKLLGKHRFNGVYSDEEYFYENRRWQMYAHTADWETYWSKGNIRGIASRPPVGVIYLGPSLSAASTASGANIPGISSQMSLNSGNVYAFDTTWTSPLNANGTPVNYNAPWDVPANLQNIFNGAPKIDPATNLPYAQLTQASNPANYVGWNANHAIDVARYNGGEDLSLLTGADKQMRKTKSYAGSWQGFWWQDAVVTTLGWRYDEVKTRGVVANPVSSNRNILNIQPNVYELPAEYPAAQTFKDHSTSGGVVVHLNKLFGSDPLPINVSLSYNKSNNFQVSNVRRNIYGTPIGNPTGETEDIGVLLSTKDGKYSFRAIKYDSKATNATTQLNSSPAGLIANGLNWRNIILYRMSGYTYSTRETPNVRHDWQPVYVDANGRGVAPATAVNPPAGSTLQTVAQGNAMRDATISAWNDIQKYLDGKGYFQAWNYNGQLPAISALTTRGTYEATLPTNPDGTFPVGASPATQYLPGNELINYTTLPSMQGFAVTADTQSKGYEFEFTANPTKNWRIAFNASESTAVRTNFGGTELTELFEFLTEKLNGPAGDLRMFNARFDDPTNVIWNNGNWTNFRGQYTLFKLQEGAAASELRKWRYNLVTNYSFDHGALKGFGVGAGYRWQDKVVIGYPVVALSQQDFSYDLSKPYYGPSEDGLDLWVSYERKISNKLNWKIQANVRNVGDGDGVVPISVQPDGQTWASVRIKPAQEWFVTNTFSF